MKFKDFMKFDGMMKGWDELDDTELKVAAIRGPLIGFLELSVISVLLFMKFHDVVLSLSFIVASFPIGILFFIINWYKDWLDDKIGLFDSNFKGISYQGAVLVMVMLGLGMSCAFFGGAYNYAGIYSGIAFGVVFLIPTCFMLLRWNVFNNDSRWLLVEDEYGNKSYEKVMGYYPLFYFLISISCCEGPLGGSIKRILEAIYLNKGYLEINVFFFIISLILCFLILSPDIMNKILPFEVKTARGMFNCGLILIGLIALVLYMMRG